MVYSHAEMYGDLMQCHKVDDFDVHKLARINITKNFLSVEKIYSKKFDLETYGYTEAEISEITQSEYEESEELRDSVRGVISDFTRASQRRLIETCSRWEPYGSLGMITLTYGQQFPDGERSRDFFRAFKERMRREWPDWSGCWKLEYQKRGAPHYHFVIDTAVINPDWKLFQNWVHNAWNSVIGSYYGDWSSGEYSFARTEFKRARNEKRAKFYLTKEVGKMVQASKEWRENMDEVIDHVGRFWGWHNRKSSNFVGSVGFVPAIVGRAILKALQGLHLLTMHEKGQILYDGETPYFKDSGLVVADEYLPSWRFTDDGDMLLAYLMEAASLELGYDVSAYFVLDSDGVVPDLPPSPPR